MPCRPPAPVCAAGRKRKAAVVESEGSEEEAASGSEYAVSSGENCGAQLELGTRVLRMQHLQLELGTRVLHMQDLAGKLRRGGAGRLAGHPTAIHLPCRAMPLLCLHTRRASCRQRRTMVLSPAWPIDLLVQARPY